MKLQRKTVISLLLLASMVLALAACSGGSGSSATSSPAPSTSAPSAEPSDSGEIDYANVTGNLLLGTAGSGGTWYTLGAAIGDVINQNSKLKVSISTTNGTVDNNRLVSTGDIDIAMSQPPAEYHAMKGEDLFAGNNIDNVRWICGGHFSKGQMVVKADSDIMSYADLAGKNVAIGAVGSGVRHYVGRGNLLLNGLDLDDIKDVAINQTQSAEALQDGDVDAAMFSGGIGLSSILSVSSVMDIRILPIDDNAIEELAKTRPEWAPAMKYFTIPAGTYGDNFEEVQTVGYQTSFLANESIPDDVIYAFLEYMYQYAPTLTDVSAEAAEYTLENMASGCCIHPHPGAVKWFADHGIEIVDPLS